MTAPVILYHGQCADGFGSAWAAYQRWGPDALYLPVQYGAPAPALPDGAPVYLLDFSYPRDVLLAMKARHPELRVLDHHRTAQADLAGLDWATFDPEKSGAVLAWECFMPQDRVPDLLLYIQDRDLWRWALDHSKEVNAWLRSYPHDFALWSVLAHRLEHRAEDPSALLEGAAILRAQAQVVEAQVAGARVEPFPVIRAEISLGPAVVDIPVANVTAHISETGEALCHAYPEALFSATYFDRPDGRRVWSLRTRRDDFDVSVVAKQFGGGGHKGAAGFTVKVGRARLADLLPGGQA